MKVDLGKKWGCECGEKHSFGVYATAHWHDELIHTCHKCNRQHSLKSGYLKLVKGKRKK